FQEPLEHERRPRWGLRFKPDKPETEPSERKERPPPKPPSDSLSALVNRDVGYGKELSLRDHQIAALHALRGRLRLLQSFIADGSEPPARGPGGQPS
ncbi:MAG: hypothetical protein UZ18_ATM001002425, partial [Armatimonadetes bacterium OLB18]